MDSRSARLARGWVVGVFATAVAAASHSLAGGGTPSALALVVGVVFGGMLGTFALSARPSAPRLVIAVSATQIAFHVGFSTLGTAAAFSPGHAHAVSLAAPAHAHTDSPLMWVGHALAGLLTLAVLRGAERAAWRLLVELARLVVSRFGAPASSPVTVRVAAGPRATSAPARLTSRILVSAASRRGPPLSVAF